MEIKDYFTIEKLSVGKDLNNLEKGIGCIYKENSITTALFHNGEAMHYIGYIEFSPNVPRGNHYHNKRYENICIIKGSVKVRYYFPQDRSIYYDVVLNAGDIVCVKPGLAHNYISESGAVAVEYALQNYEQADVIPCKIEW